MIQCRSSRSGASPPQKGRAASGGAAPKLASKTNQNYWTKPPIASETIVRLELTTNQAAILAPLAIDASRNRENVLFISIAAPYWSPDAGLTAWELQVCRLPARVGDKVSKLIREVLAK